MSTECLDDLESKVEFLERAFDFERQHVHPLTFLESDDCVWRALANRNLLLHVVHVELVRKTRQDVVQKCLDLRKLVNNQGLLRVMM